MVETTVGEHAVICTDESLVVAEVVNRAAVLFVGIGLALEGDWVVVLEWVLIVALEVEMGPAGWQCKRQPAEP